MPQAVQSLTVPAMLIALGVFRSRFDFSRRSTRVYAATIAVLFVLVLVGYLPQRG